MHKHFPRPQTGNARATCSIVDDKTFYPRDKIHGERILLGNISSNRERMEERNREII